MNAPKQKRGLDGRSRRIYLNGKWLAQSTTGTQRYATEIARRLVARLGDRITIVTPKGVDLPDWTAGATIRRSRLTGNSFEQFVLPIVTFGQYLLNLSGSSPLFKRKQGIVLFDASVFRYGDTFSWMFTRWYRLLYRTARYRSEQLFTISRFSRDELAEVLRIEPARLHVIPCGADHLPDPTGRYTAPISTPYVVMIGSLTERKNLSGPLTEFARRGIRTAVVGAGGRSSVFAHSGIPDDEHIVPLGRLDDAEIVDLLAGATAMVFPSLYEGFGLPIVEAQRVGCPVVCANSSSLPEAAGDGALFFDPNYPSAAADEVESLLVDAHLRTHLQARGYANVIPRSWESSADQLFRIIEGGD